MSERIIFDVTAEDGKRQILRGSAVGDREIFVEGVWGVQMSHNIFKMTMFTIGPELNQKEERREVAVRLAMPLPALFALQEFLLKQCMAAVKAGYVELAPTASGEPEPTDNTEPTNTDTREEK